MTEAEILAAADYAEVLRTWRERRGFSKRALADRMHYDRTYVAHIENGNQRPTEDFTRTAEDVLATDGALWAAWNTFVAVRTRQRHATRSGTTRDLRNPAYMAWVADRSPLGFQEAYNSVAHLIDETEAEPPAVRHARVQARSRVSRADIANALIRYYGAPLAGEADGLGFYAVDVDGAGPLRLSVLTHRDWLDVAVPLGGDAERTHFVVDRDEPEPLDTIGLRAALRRLAEVEASDTVFVNNPLYRLTDITVGPGRIDATFSGTDFLTYALRNDLIEVELVDALANGARPGKPDGRGTARLALRERYLPDVAHALDLDARHCIGGLGTLMAVARPDADDYMLLIQERSARVLNVTGRLAVIPKAFHQPTIEASRETAVSATVWRELEEELLGREDLEMLTDARHADPLHDASRSEPMQWLADHLDAVRIECTGFGINMVTGNYEFACLVIIDDPTWWRTYGHLVGANWEALRLRRYSTRDTTGLTHLAADPTWSNEGLFALIQGMRRLDALGNSDRLALPATGTALYGRLFTPKATG